MDEKEVTLSGKILDFENNPLKDAIVEIKNDHFETLYHTCSNAKGEYEIGVKKGLYFALVAVKDYKTKYLEYWAWNVPAYQDLQLDPHIGSIEVYAMNAFVPQGAYPSLILYFRPMGLKRFHKLKSAKASKESSLIDISPDLTKDDIEVRINGESVKILELNKVREYAGGIHSILAYLLQLSMPKRSLIAYLIQLAMHVKIPERAYSGYFRIDVTLRDTQTAERGEGCLFWKRQRANTIQNKASAEY